MSDTPTIVGKLLDRKEDDYVEKKTGQEVKDLDPVMIEYPGMKDGTEKDADGNKKTPKGMVTINGISSYEDDMSQFTKNYKEEDPFVQKIRAFQPQPFVPPDDLLDDSTVSLLHRIGVVCVANSAIVDTCINHSRTSFWAIVFFD